MRMDNDFFMRHFLWFHLGIPLAAVIAVVIVALNYE